MANVSAFSGAMPVIPGGLVEVAQVSRTASNYTTSATSLSGASNFFDTNLTFVADGGPYLIEWFCPGAFTATAAGAYSYADLVDGSGTSLGTWYVIAYGDGTRSAYDVPYARYRYTPTAGTTVTLNVRATVSNVAHTATYTCGAGGAGVNVPATLRVSKIVNQNDGLKPFWTPPVVTQLPSQATVGDQVIYAANATDGVYWHLQYDGLGTYPWKFIGGTALRVLTSGGGTLTSTSYSTSFSNGATSLTLPLAGDYDVVFGARELYLNGAANGIPAHLNVGTSAPGDNTGACQMYGYNSNSTYWTQISASTMSTRRLTGLSATTLNMYGRSDALQIGTTDRYINATPIRVKAT